MRISLCNAICLSKFSLQLSLFCSYSALGKLNFLNHTTGLLLTGAHLHFFQCW